MNGLLEEISWYERLLGVSSGVHVCLYIAQVEVSSEGYTWRHMSCILEARTAWNTRKRISLQPPTTSPAYSPKDQSSFLAQFVPHSVNHRHLVLFYWYMQTFLTRFNRLSRRYDLIILFDIFFIVTRDWFYWAKSLAGLVPADVCFVLFWCFCLFWYHSVTSVPFCIPWQ